MLSYALRRLAFGVPTLLLISLAIFMLLQLAPGDPMASVPLTVPPEVKARMREALGLGEPALVQYLKWLRQMLWVEPRLLLDWATADSRLLGWLPDTASYEGEQRVLSWQTRSPVMDIVVERLPQTLWVVGLAYLLGALIALPLGILSACRQHSLFDQAATLVAMLGFSVPPFFTGPLLIVVFSVGLGWLPSVYDTTLVVRDWDSLLAQLRQMAMPVAVLALQVTAQISRYMRAAMLDTLGEDYLRTARAKGLRERRVIGRHALRNALIPVVTVLALGAPAIFGGAIITETIFKVNGIGHLLITALFANDLPMVMTLTFLFAVLIVLCNLLADLLYGLLDPRIRYD
ncbi:ABC transporter permease [Roseivivax sp. CAU 1761]